MNIDYINYQDETQLGPLADLIAQELSEPYSVYTYRYFLISWPEHCFLAMLDGKTIGGIICKLDKHRQVLRGYIGMLVVDKAYRKQGIASRLVAIAIESMKSNGCQEVVLETEVVNFGALNLYEKLGFIRDKRLCRYYLNGQDAFRLKLFIVDPMSFISTDLQTPSSSNNNISERTIKT